MKINDRYELIKKLEDCGIYNLLQARDDAQKYYYIKTLKEELSDKKEYLELTKKRIGLINSLQIPMNVVKSTGTFERYFYLVEDFRDFRSLTGLSSKLNNETLLIKIFDKITGALKKFHESGIYFGLLSTEYIKINQNFDIYFQDSFLDISNFEILKHMSNFLTNKRIVFMAPEVVNLEKLTARSDVYSLGMMLALFLTGKLPFQVHDFFEFGPKSKQGISEVYLESIPEKWRGFISGMISINEEERLSLEAVIRGLSQIGTGPVSVCQDHPDKIAVEFCSRCGKPLCYDCIKMIKDHPFCSDCADTLEMHLTNIPSKEEEKKKEEEKVEHFCEFHPKRHSLPDPCPGCGKYFCRDCLEELDGVLYCANCFLKRKEQKDKEHMKLVIEEQKLREQKNSERLAAQKKAEEEKKLQEAKKQDELFRKIQEDKKKQKESPPPSPEPKPETVSAVTSTHEKTSVLSIEQTGSDKEKVSVSVSLNKKLLIIISSVVLVIVLIFAISVFLSKGKTKRLDKKLKEQIALYVSDLSTNKYKGKEFDQVRLSLADLYYEDERFDDYIKTLREIYEDDKTDPEIRKTAYTKLKEYLDKKDPELVKIFEELNNPDSGFERKQMANDQLLTRYIELSLHEDSIKMLAEKINDPKENFDNKLKYSKTLANIYKKRKMFKEGIKVMQDFLDSTPGGNNEIRRLARLSLGDYYRSIGWYNSAKKEYDVLVRHYYPDYTEGKLAYKAIAEMKKEGKIK
ncbi:MAG: protein kinase [bacterium]|nr:protein kinase [bacterium]